MVVLPENRQREQVTQWLAAKSAEVRVYARLSDCLRALRDGRDSLHGCVVCPLRDSSMSGLEFQREIGRLPHVMTVVFYVADAEIAEVVAGMRNGAIAVVRWTDDVGILIDYVAEALETSRAEFLQVAHVEETLSRLRRLNVGEHQVLQGIMAGKLNKEIAQELSLSIRTIEQRRREVFRKMDVQHPASLACKVVAVAQSSRLRTETVEDALWLTGLRRDFAHEPRPRAWHSGQQPERAVVQGKGTDALLRDFS
jgi:FixJ family two-component response regulator